MHTVLNAGTFDWGSLIGAASEMSLFGDRQFIELRIPGGKPGKEGSQALQRYIEQAAGKLGIADLNPDDIESIEVLKGASAAAIYGSLASARARGGLCEESSCV